MKKLLLSFLIIRSIADAHALVIHEVMSNPVGDDSGREWVEVYNNEEIDVDISSLTISIKGGTPVVVTPLSGGTIVPRGGYAIIASTVSGSTKFLQDYGNYSGLLFKSSLSLVNTGVTSIDIRLGGQVVNAIASYTAAKEGSTLSLVNGSFVQTTPTPGSANTSDTSVSQDEFAATSTPTSQVTVSKQVPPAPDIIIHVPFEKIAVAGAPARFSAYGTRRDDTPVNDLRFSWAFGDGGEATGSSTLYRYAYPGRYIAHVEARNNTVYGEGVERVHVVSPELTIASVGSGKYGTYVDIQNGGMYDLNISDWRLLFDGVPYVFPRNTIIAGHSTTRLSGLAMGFASTTVKEGGEVALVFPNQERIAQFIHTTQLPQVLGTSTTAVVIQPVKPRHPVLPKKIEPKVATTSARATTAVHTTPKKKDTRIASFFKSLFGK